MTSKLQMVLRVWSVFDAVTTICDAPGSNAGMLTVPLVMCTLVICWMPSASLTVTSCCLGGPFRRAVTLQVVRAGRP